MKTRTFKSIFGSFQNENGSPEITKIVIPKIQRDFAYGRCDEKNSKKRLRFLDALFDAVNGSPITLDFIYGDIRDGVLTPLDGQQRLTTLFLLYWFASKKENVPPGECDFLKKFSYETRPAARYFCEKIVNEDFNPNITSSPSLQIKDKNWFHLEWQHDATVASMLVMLDAIWEKFSSVEDLFGKLANISFYFLPIENMGLTDELYIKMNSRGKPLTRFEHFKAELEKLLAVVDPEAAKRIGAKIDREWTDLIWQYRDSHTGDENSDNTTDDEFLRYFVFICNVICYESNGSPRADDDEFALLRKYFTVSENEDEAGIGREDVLKNIQTLENYFDCWLVEKKSIDIKSFFESFSSDVYTEGKIKTAFPINLFEDCLRNSGEVDSQKRRKFTLGQIIMLYAFAAYRQNFTKIEESAFRRRLRIVNNLLKNSSDEISDSEDRVGGNRMPAILAQVHSVIVNGMFLDAKVCGINFSAVQIEEEKLKLKWTNENPTLKESLFELEDHELLYGQISIVDLEHPEYFSRFGSLFKCNWDLVDCALLSIGDYKQKDRNGRRYQLGSSMREGFAWKMLFHKSALNGFESTKNILADLLSRCSDFTDDKLREIINAFIQNCEDCQNYPWRYYYVKYDNFRPSRYGRYWWEDFNERPYEFLVLHQKQKASENSYDPFLMHVGTVNRESCGTNIILDDNWLLEVRNSSYVIRELNVEKPQVKECSIHQKEGLDSENRVEKLIKMYPNIKDGTHGDFVLLCDSREPLLALM